MGLQMLHQIREDMKAVVLQDGVGENDISEYAFLDTNYIQDLSNGKVRATTPQLH
jgi:hypothetical protein